MSEKAQCSDCVSCAPNEAAASKSEFVFPEDHECLMEIDWFPDYAHLCMSFQNAKAFWKYDKDGGLILK